MIAENIKMTIFSKDYLGLTEDFKVNPNSCGNADYYERYLKEQALIDQDNGLCVTHVFVRLNPSNQVDKIIGYITLSASSLNIRDNKDDFGNFPAIKIEYIAIDIHFERRGIGTKLLNHTIFVAEALRRNYIGIAYIVVCADLDAVGLYTKYGFEKCASEKRSNAPYNINMILELA